MYCSTVIATTLCDHRPDFIEELRSCRDSPPTEAPREHCQPGDDERKRKDHAHCQPSSKVLQARIGFAKEFAENARGAVNNGKRPANHARTA